MPYPATNYAQSTPNYQQIVPSEPPTVTVLIPAHNEGQYIASCIHSVLSNSWPRERLQIIVIDHNSSDETASIARKTGATVISADSNSKIGGVRNLGISAAQGEFTAFVDADCIVPKTWLATAISLLTSDRTVGAVGGGPALSPPSGTWVEHCIAPAQGRSGIVQVVTTLPACSFISRTQLLRSLGSFNEDVLSGEDDDISNKIRKYGLKLLLASDCRVTHFGFPRTLSGVLRKEIWHGSNHLDVRSRFDITLLLTFLFIFTAIGIVTAVLSAIIIIHIHLLHWLVALICAHLLSPMLYSLKKLKRSHWQLNLALPAIAVGYVYFLGHGIGVLTNAYRKLFSH